MLWRIALSLSLLSFGLASQARAASVRIDVVFAGGTNWDLRLTNAGVESLSALALVVSDSLTSFTPSPAFAGPPPGCALGGCDLTPVGTMPGFNLLVLNASIAGFVPAVYLGTFHSNVSSAALVQVLPADDVAGGTVFNAQGTPIQDFTIHVAPEPAGALLVSLTCLLASRRRSF